MNPCSGTASSPGFASLLAELGRQIHLCLSCNACRAECPINGATDRLKPLHLVRGANMGLQEELLGRGELWACLQCKRCSWGCPMSVGPSVLIRALREEAISRPGGAEWGARHRALNRDLQRVRWHGVAHLIASPGADPVALAERWDEWAATPPSRDLPPFTPAPPHPGLEEDLGVPLNLAACMTCGECTTVCPVAHEVAVFDPRRLFRWASLGPEYHLLSSPSLWLCLGCQSCTTACTQLVQGHRLIQALQRLALEQEAVPGDLPEGVLALDRALYRRYVEEVDRLLKGAIHTTGS